MRVIYKHPFPLRGGPLIAPKGIVRLVARQHGAEVPTLWIEQDNDVPTEDCEYRFYATGEPIRAGLTHVGSCICGPFVWHVYRT